MVMRGTEASCKACNKARRRRVHAPAAEFLRLDRLADGDLGHTAACNRHGCAFAHDDDVGEARVPRGRAVATPEQRGEPRSGAVAQVFGGVRAHRGAALCAHAIGETRAGGFTEQDERHAVPCRKLLGMPDLLAVDDA